MRISGVGLYFLSLFLPLISMGQGDPTDSSMGAYRVTYYYVADEGDYSLANRNVPVLTPEGTVLVRVSAPFKRALDIEGTAKLLDGRVFNYVSNIGKDIRYRFVSAPFGLGVKHCELIPFHSIAVDPKKIPLGSLVHISKTEGMLLPDGTRHNGLWYAHDIGSAIQNDRIDLFVGAGIIGGVTLDHANIGNLEALDVTLIAATPADSCVNRDDVAPAAPSPSPLPAR